MTQKLTNNRNNFHYSGVLTQVDAKLIKPKRVDKSAKRAFKNVKIEF
jgi:hypothetical protein